MNTYIKLSAIALSLVAAKSAEAKKPTNVIFVLADDYSCGEHGIYGNKEIQTPHLDKLAQESARFENFYVAPTSSPTRAQLMSGKHEFRVGVTHTTNPRCFLNIEEKILPQFFNESGYATAHFGKWHLGDDEVDDKYSARNRGWSYSIVSNYAKHFNPNLRVNGKMQKFEGFRTDILFNEAQKWMSGQLKSKKPFFCYIALNSAHAPLACTPEYKDLYKDNKNITERSILYYAMVSNIDDNMGRLVEYMKKNKLYENTVLVYMTDNGHLGNDYNAGMRGSKNSPWRGGSRVPCFFHCPDKFKGGVEINELGGALDFLPTVLDLCDIKLDKDVDGVSLAPLLYDNKKTMPERFLVSHTGRWLHGQAEKGKYNQYAIQNKRYRLVNNDSLYDIETDPGETKNIIDQHPELVKQMREWYEAWWQKTLPLMCNEQTAVDMGVPNTKVPGERKTKKKK